MQIKTILNRIQKHRGFVYGTVQFEEQIAGLALTVDIAPHRRNRPRCAGCGQAGPAYDRLAPRRFEFVPLWGVRVFFLYMMRRVACPRCGVTVEQVPWADGKHQFTTTYRWFLARWAKRLSWQEVARVFGTSWDQVFRAVAMAVAWGRDHVDLTGIRAIGIDEIHWQHGGDFLTLIYQIDPTRKRLLWIGQHRRAKTLLQFFRWFGAERSVDTLVEWAYASFFAPVVKTAVLQRFVECAAGARWPSREHQVVDCGCRRAPAGERGDDGEFDEPKVIGTGTSENAPGTTIVDGGSLKDPVRHDGGTCDPSWPEAGLSFERRRAQIPDRGVSAALIVEHLDVLE
jgi:hypothetical protein